MKMSEQQKWRSQIRMGESQITLNGIVHIIPAKWLDQMSVKFLREMDDKIGPDDIICYKLPDLPGNDQDWHEFKETMDVLPGTRFEIKRNSS